MSKKATAHLLMVFLVIAWGFDYVPAKLGLEVLTPMCLMFLKYCIGFLSVLIIKIITKSKYLLRVKDIPLFLLCSFFGEISYFFCEYRAMSYIPVSLLTIILAFVPVVSVFIERIVFKVKANKIIYLGITFCVIGVIFVIGPDFKSLFNGRILGYLLAVGAVFAWNIYNYITARIDGYTSTTLSMNQMICSILLISPVAIHNMPAFSAFTPTVIAGILWIGVIDSGLGFIITVNALRNLGPTTSAVYSDFMPVTATLFSSIFLGESISVIQMAGGVIVIIAGYFVIREKGRLDDERLDKERLNEIEDGDIIQ